MHFPIVTSIAIVMIIVIAIIIIITIIVIIILTTASDIPAIKHALDQISNRANKS